MQVRDMPGCCAAVVLEGLGGLTLPALRQQLKLLQDEHYDDGVDRGSGSAMVLATTARQANAEKILKQAGFKMLLTAMSNHGEYPVNVWGKSLRKKLRAKKKKKAL